MNAFANLLSLPLLGRELRERAARLRTYAVRVGYGLVLYTIFVFAVQRLVGQAAADNTGLGGLGFGRELFRTLIIMQCWGILALQPALMAGGITYEKERDSLSLLFLTGMPMWKIALEKFLAGLLPMATLLLLALPLGAITMGYGGVSPQLIVAGAFVIMATWLMAGAFALLCSAWFRTTMSAIIAAYAAGMGILLAGAVAYSLTDRYVLWGANLSGVEVPPHVWALWPPSALEAILRWQQSAGALSEGGADWSALLGVAWKECSSMFAAAAIFFLLAVIALQRRGLLVPQGSRERERRPGVISRAGAKMLGWWDKLWPPPPPLPTDDPIVWRESGRSRMGTRAQFVYASVLIAGATLALSLLLLGMYPRTGGPERLHYFACVLGAGLVLVLIVRSASALLNEQTNQTLDILLTTPISAREILKEKAGALMRYHLLTGTLLGIVFLLQGWSEHEYDRTEMGAQQLGQYWLCAGIGLAVYPLVIIWGSMLLALIMRARTKAILAALGIYAVWFLAPILTLNAAVPDWRDKPVYLWLSLTSPLGILEANEEDKLTRFAEERIVTGRLRTRIVQPWAPVAYNYGFYLAIAFGLRWGCLRFADRWLRR